MCQDAADKSNCIFGYARFPRFRVCVDDGNGLREQVRYFCVLGLDNEKDPIMPVCQGTTDDRLTFLLLG